MQRCRGWKGGAGDLSGARELSGPALGSSPAPRDAEQRSIKKLRGGEWSGDRTRTAGLVGQK